MSRPGVRKRSKHGRNDTNNSWGDSRYVKPNRPMHPPGLSGREIGLYYRNLKKSEKKSSENIVSLKVPFPVISKLKSNIKAIEEIANKKAIKIVPKPDLWSKSDGGSSISKGDSFTEEECFTEDTEFPVEKTTSLEKFDISTSCNTISSKPSNKNDISSSDSKNNSQSSTTGYDIKSIPKEDISMVASSSKAPDFIPVKSDYTSEYNYNNSEKLLSLRGAGDFKYGYDDIVTGTFTEKLDSCLSAGINITKTTNDICQLSLDFYEELQAMKKKSVYHDMLKFRQTLPTYKKAEDILNVINNNQVIVISGETGCGKSTQVPQIILDDAIMNKKGANVKILITQPRRIAASSLAARVAKERAESMGASVGFAVRLEKIDARTRGSMMFCTTGVLLVDLETNQGLTDYSHIILDEVHERDCHVDFAMCMLKQVLQKRKDLKLILMSATLDAENLSAFFNNCPTMHIEGLAYPVKDIYLEEILHLIHFELEPQHLNFQKNKRLYGGRRNKMAAQIIETAIEYKAEITPWIESIKHKLNRSVYETLLDHRIEILNINLVFEVVKYLCRGPPGAILVFLPGIGEISKLIRLINENLSYLGSRCEIYPLHSKLPSLDQNKIFERPPSHIRKIIVATNIAETSITVDDIVYVVDCGKIKYSGLNVENYLSTLKTEWVSQANLRQRRGRAGRCQPGFCYHLVTTFRAEKLSERLLPELQRSNLLEAILTIKRLRLGKAVNALKNVPDPPSETTTEKAVTHLRQCGALDDQENLTPLGWHLARLPVHPAAGKLVLLGALFGCLNRAASVAAVWSFKDPFIMVIDKDDEVKAVKRKLSLGEPSDHVAISEALIKWEQCSSSSKYRFAYSNFLSSSTLQLLSEMKRQIGDNLRNMGFLASGRIDSEYENRNTDNLSLFKAIVAAALYPNIATVKWMNLNSCRPIRQMKIKVSIPEGHICIHPSSLMCLPKVTPKGRTISLCTNPGANWLVYWLKQKSSDTFLIEVTLVYTLPLLFFGELKVSSSAGNDDFCYLSISEYKIYVKKETADLLLHLRKLLDQVLASKIMISSCHSKKYFEFEEKVLNSVIELITAEDERAVFTDESDYSDY